MVAYGEEQVVVTSVVAVMKHIANIIHYIYPWLMEWNYWHWMEWSSKLRMWNRRHSWSRDDMRWYWHHRWMKMSSSSWSQKLWRMAHVMQHIRRIKREMSITMTTVSNSYKYKQCKYTSSKLHHK